MPFLTGHEVPCSHDPSWWWKERHSREAEEVTLFFVDNHKNSFPEAFLHLERDDPERRGHRPNLWDDRERSLQSGARLLGGGDHHFYSQTH